MRRGMEPSPRATFRLLLRVKVWMDAELSPDGYNVGWNCGRVGGQEVFHAHLHVIPRFRQEPLAGQGIRSHLKSEANSIWRYAVVCSCSRHGCAAMKQLAWAASTAFEK